MNGGSGRGQSRVYGGVDLFPEGMIGQTTGFSDDMDYRQSRHGDPWSRGFGNDSLEDLRRNTPRRRSSLGSSFGGGAPQNTGSLNEQQRLAPEEEARRDQEVVAQFREDCKTQSALLAYRLVRYTVEVAKRGNVYHKLVSAYRQSQQDRTKLRGFLDDFGDREEVQEYRDRDGRRQEQTVVKQGVFHDVVKDDAFAKMCAVQLPMVLTVEEGVAKAARGYVHVLCTQQLLEQKPTMIKTRWKTSKFLREIKKLRNDNLDKYGELRSIYQEMSSDGECIRRDIHDFALALCAVERVQDVSRLKELVAELKYMSTIRGTDEYKQYDHIMFELGRRLPAALGIGTADASEECCEWVYDCGLDCDFGEVHDRCSSLPIRGPWLAFGISTAVAAFAVGYGWGLHNKQPVLKPVSFQNLVPTPRYVDEKVECCTEDKVEWIVCTPIDGRVSKCVPELMARRVRRVATSIDNKNGPEFVCAPPGKIEKLVAATAEYCKKLISKKAVLSISKLLHVV